MSDLPEAARAFADGDVALLPAALADADGAALVALLVERGDAARQLIEDGYKRTLAAGRVPPEAFARARLSLGHLEPETRHPSLEAAPPKPIAEVRGALPTLHALPELRTWIPPEEALPALDLEI